jgi:hypothetical protein
MALDVGDILSIQKLLADYNHAVDQGDGDAFAAMFVEGGSLRRGDQLTEGRDDLNSFARSLPPGIRHIVSNISIDGDGDDAQTRAYVQVWSTAGGGAETRVLVSGIYADTLVRDAGTWRFVARVLAYDS